MAPFELSQLNIFPIRADCLFRKIWQVATRKLRHILSRHKGEIMSLCFANADAILASVACSEGELRLRNVETGALLHEIRVRNVASLLGSPNHRFVVATIATGEVAIVCDAERGRCFGFSAHARAAAFAPDGRSLITGCWNGSEEGLWTWDLGPLLDCPVWELNGQDPPFFSRWESPEVVGMRLGGRQVSPGLPLLLKMLILSIRQALIKSLSISSDGRLVASTSSDDGDLVVWDLDVGQAVMKMGGGGTARYRVRGLHTLALYCNANSFVSDPKRHVLAGVNYCRRMPGVCL